MAFGLLLVFALVCYGWGRWLTRLCYGKHTQPAPAFEIVLGIAVLAAVGGLLNLLHLARPASLYIVSAIGLVLSAAFIRQQAQSVASFSSSPLGGKLWRGTRSGSLLAYTPHCVMWIAAAFFCINLLPAAALNRVDDMHTYLVRPIRMLQTGSIGGNAFDMLGLDSLGAQSFLQSFLLLASPLVWANAFDAVFCFALSGFLILTIAQQMNVQWHSSLLAIVAFISINPQLVNISALYSSTAIILGSFLACAKLVEAIQSNESAAHWKVCVPLALLLAALLALKNTSVLLLAVQLPVFFAVLALTRPLRQRALAAAGVTAAGATLALLPWLAVTFGTYSFPVGWPGHDFAPTALATKYPSLAAHDAASLFKMTRLFYGGDQLTYTSIALCVVFCGIAALVHRRFATAAALSAPAPAFAAAAIGSFAAYLLNAHMNDAPAAVRYSCPMFLAIFPLAGLILVPLFALTPNSAPDAAPTPPFLRIVPTLLPISVIILFLPVSFTRFHQALNAKSVLSFPLLQGDLIYNRYAVAVGGPRARALQERTEPGETILAWIDQPFGLDFTRNRILNVCDPGLVNPLLRFPAGVTETELRQYFQSRGIRYILHQSEGAGRLSQGELSRWLNGYPLHRKIAEYHIYLKGALLNMCETSRLLYRDDQIALFDLNASDEQTVTRR